MAQLSTKSTTQDSPTTTDEQGATLPKGTFLERLRSPEGQAEFQRLLKQRAEELLRQQEGSGAAESQAVEKPSYDTVSLDVRRGGSYWGQKQHFRLNENRELEVWAGTGKLDSQNKEIYSWQSSNASQENATNSLSVPKYSCLYVHNGEIYDAKGSKVQWLATGGDQRIITEHLLSNIDLKDEGRVCGLKPGQLNALTYGGQQVVFTKGLPPGMAEGFVGSTLNGDTASKRALVPSSSIKTQTFEIDAEGKVFHSGSNSPITGFDSQGVWSTGGKPQLRIVKTEQGYSCERRIHEPQRGTWGEVIGYKDTWVSDPAFSVKPRN